MIAVDQEPLRDGARIECRKVMAGLEKARKEWRRFETQDLPAFERWLAGTFGQMLTKLREVAALVHEKEMLVREVEIEMCWGGARSYAAAYRRVIDRRSRPAPEFDGFDPFGDGASSGAAEPDEPPSEFEQGILFEELLRRFMGVNPDHLDDAAYEEMFSDFKQHAFPRGGPGRQAEQLNGSKPHPEHLRVKELYRILVRRLHPDLRADKEADVSMLWHEVQEAYEKGNVERLETLLALTDVQEDSVGAHTTLFQLRSVLKELRSAWRALQRSLRGARKQDAWHFSRSPDRSRLATRIERRLRTDLDAGESRLNQLESMLQSWVAPPVKRRSKKRKIPVPDDLPF